eukprot:5296087-Alexandrium_andersonii.AAC.1
MLSSVALAQPHILHRPPATCGWQGDRSSARERGASSAEPPLIKLGVISDLSNVGARTPRPTILPGSIWATAS